MFKLEIETTNAAFDDDPSYEVTRLLDSVYRRVTEGEYSGSLRDYNGNKVGYFRFTPEDF